LLPAVIVGYIARLAIVSDDAREDLRDVIAAVMRDAGSSDVPG
jgi:hypothetical protein